MSPARVLVTGAEGRVGRALVPHLVRAGHAVTTLTLPDATPLEDVTVVRGDARDPEAVARGLRGAEAVVHLAAFPDPFGHLATDVFANNTQATFCVLWTAAGLGVRRLVIASSVNATGLLMNPHRPLPDRYPVDEDTATDIADPYSLSKRVDEETLRAACRRFSATGVALRLPLMISPSGSEGMVTWAASAARVGAADGWGWLDTRDAAEAFRLAATVPLSGVHVLHLAATRTLMDRPTEELLDAYAPGVPRGPLAGGRSPAVSTARARELLGFAPRYDAPGQEDR